MKLIRLGSCNHCGYCCSSTCANFSALSVKNCAVHGTELQPWICKVWPRHPKEISQHAECGFKFYDADTLVEITKKQKQIWNEDGKTYVWWCDWKILNSYEDVLTEC